MKKFTSLFICFFCLTFSLAPLHAEEAAKNNKTISLETNQGTIIIELFDKKAPVSSANFRRYVKEKFYDGLIFHRVIPGFVIQGGGFETGMKVRQPNHGPITNEAGNGLKNSRGTLSMARTSRVNSATSQFFINLRDNRSLDHRNNNPNGFGYAVFGRVVKGMDVVDKIAATKTTTVKAFRDVPASDMTIIKAYETE